MIGICKQRNLLSTTVSEITAAFQTAHGSINPRLPNSIHGQVCGKLRIQNSVKHRNFLHQFIALETDSVRKDQNKRH